MRSEQFHLKWGRFPALLLAGVINALGVTIFLYPVNLYDSGVSGTSMLLAQLTHERVPLSLFLVLLNVPLFLFGLKRQGKEFTVYSLFAVAVYSVSAWLITDVLPIDVAIASPLAGQDLLLCALFGGIISGLGSGLTIRLGGAIDGVEVMAVIFAKRLGLTVGTFVMIYNVALYIVCGAALSSWILPLYSIVTYAAALKTVDFVVEGIDRSKAATIITSKPKAVCDALSQQRRDLDGGLGRLLPHPEGHGLFCGQPLPDQPNAGYCPRNRPLRLYYHQRRGRRVQGQPGLVTGGGYGIRY